MLKIKMDGKEMRADETHVVISILKDTGLPTKDETVKTA